MLSLRQQTMKIIRQLFGKENIFGYQTTLANQLFLLYCFCGKIYFTDKINNSFKFVWLLYHLSGLLVGYVVAVVFLLYDRQPNIIMQLYMINVIANSSLMGFFIYFVTFLYGDGIEGMIREIDQITRNRSLQKGRSGTEREPDLWKYALRNIVIEVISGVIFGNVCVLDVIIFYEDEKITNYAYYLFPFPNIDEVGSLRMFLISTALSSIILSSQGLIALSAMTLILIWNAVCHSQLHGLANKLDYKSAILSSRIEKNHGNFGLVVDTEKIFKKIVVEGVLDFQKITRLVENFRPFFQSFCSSAVPVTIIGVVAQLHSIVSTNLPLVVKIKGIGMMVAVAYPLLLFCWVGETLENSVSKVSCSVYSMPWYSSISFRKDTYLFLCQTQSDLKFTALVVYPMRLRTFSRFSHFVSSTVNFLHQLSRQSIQMF